MTFSFADAERYLLGTINETLSPRTPYRLERMRAFLAELGDPQKRYPSVHIAGTSGKGSTSTMIATVLQSAGRRVGLHTKPHLRSMTERARVDGMPIDEMRFAALLDEMMPAIERVVETHGRPTYYETLLALTLSYFAHERIDIAVIEAGLGGRLDGTNLITPQVAAITSIGYDHMDVLGDTLESIAAEKAGIAKAGVPLIVTVNDPSVRAVIAEHAGAAGAPLVFTDDVARIEPRASEPYLQRCTVTTQRGAYDVMLPLLGTFQRRNAVTAIVALEHLDEALRPSIETIERGLALTTIPGRMECFPGYPTVVFDIAHNAEKAEYLVASLREHFPSANFSFVVAIGESKDAAQILRTFAPAAARFVFTTFSTPGRHATAPQRLANIAESIGTWGRSVYDPVEALAIARRETASNDVVVVTGSTFVVAELREWWLEHVGRPRPSHA